MVNKLRDLLYVKDAVQGVIKAMESSSNSADVFLLSTNTETSVNKVLKSIENIVEYQSKCNSFRFSKR